jgi:uncharacterized membrane protein
MRDWLKTTTYGAMHLMVAMAVAYALTGSWKIALGIGLIEPAVQTVFYSLHERLWRRADRRLGDTRPAAKGAPGPAGRRPRRRVRCVPA